MSVTGRGSDLARVIAPRGTLRAVINFGNPVLAYGDATAPAGVTVVLAQELAAWLRVPLELAFADAARDAYGAMAGGRVDVCFLANEPARQEHVAFTPPYLVLEGVYATRSRAAFADSTQVDREGVRIAVRRGSAYDLYLSRTITAAQLVRADSETDAYERLGLEVVAGVRQPLEEYASSSGDHILEPPFMRIEQAVGLPRDTPREAIAAVAGWLEHIRTTEPVRRELERRGAQA
jgi:polar amino acid transport system substrate-binding protein